MSPPIIFKQRHFSSTFHRKNTAGSNAQHLKYIGEREHVLTKIQDNNAAHVRYIGERENVAIKESAAEQTDINGLFGYVKGQFSDAYSTEEMMSYVAKCTTPSRDIYRCVFSFTPESAKFAKLNTLADWQDWVKFHITEVADKMGISTKNIEYLAAVHLKEGQPHVHIMYWDIKQDIAKYKVQSDVCDSIRLSVTKSTYRDYFNELHNTEDELTKTLRKGVANKTADIMDNEIAKADYDKYIEAALEDIVCHLPRKGQIVYKLMPPDIKEKINALTHFIINNDNELSALFNDISVQRELYNKMLHSRESQFGRLMFAKYMGRLNYDIERDVGNAILRQIIAEKKKACETQNVNIPDPIDEEVRHTPAAAVYVAPNLPLLLHRYRKAIKPKTQAYLSYRIAKIYKQGGNIDDAVKWFTISNTIGNTYAAFQLGKIYIRCDDIAKVAEGVSLLESIPDCHKLSNYAKCSLGTFYLFDENNRNGNKAIELLTCAAENGNSYAEQLLEREMEYRHRVIGRITMSVMDVIQNLLRSSNENFQSAANIAFGRGDLSKEQIAELIYKKRDKENTAEM